jgi:hypothetical protein
VLTLCHSILLDLNHLCNITTCPAGKIAGLDVLRIINEPTAASLAYGFERKSNETILVFDLGGGTFDVSILEVGDGVFEVLSTSGDTHLGGDDFDKRIVDFLADDFQKNEGIDLRKDRCAGVGSFFFFIFNCFSVFEVFVKFLAVFFSFLNCFSVFEVFVKFLEMQLCIF